MAVAYNPALESYIKKYSSTAGIHNFTNVAGIGIVSGVPYINVSGSVVRLADLLAGATDPTTTVNIGAKNGSTVSVVEYGDAFFHKSVFTLTATPQTVADATAGGGTKIYTFPEGYISIVGGFFSLTPTTTSALAGTLHASTTLDVGVGTAAAAAGALTTTEDDIIDSIAGTSSATINVAGAASAGVRTSAAIQLDGHSSAKTANVNIGVPTATDIDADATVTITGSVTIIWTFNGDA